MKTFQLYIVSTASNYYTIIRSPHGTTETCSLCW